MPERSETSAADGRPQESARSPAPPSPAGDSAGAARGRRPYQRPQILFREPLEAMASVCAPHPPAKGNPGACPSGPISS
jgi:hypothetical protein